MRKQQKPKPKAQKKEIAPKQESATAEKTEPENPFDFGGLPSRDLKKNLGCG